MNRPLNRRRVLTLGLAFVGLVLLCGGGTLLAAQPAPVRTAPLPSAGRTSVACAPAVYPGARGYLAVASLRSSGQSEPTGKGSVSGAQVNKKSLALELTEPGTAKLLPGPAQPAIVRSEGEMATAASAMMFSRANSGSLSGLMAAPCSPPDTDQWFVGVGASTDHRTDLVLTNPDEGEAEVDLRFYGRTGLVVVPGSPGLVIEGRSSRTVALDSLVKVDGPLTVQVRASRGRVSATALDLRSADLQPRGADWLPSSLAPATGQVVPGIPEGAGSRSLVIVNPGTERAEVSVEVLGIEGPFVPVGTENLVVQPESTVEVDLTAGLGGQAGNVRLTSTRPVTAAVQSTSAVAGDLPDLALSPAVRPINRAGIVPLATVRGLDSEFTLTNAGDAEVTITFEQHDYAGQQLRRDDIVLIPGGSATRRLEAPSTSYLVVRTPQGSAVYGALNVSGDLGRVGGLTNIALVSPDQAGPTPQVGFDPSLGR